MSSTFEFVPSNKDSEDSVLIFFDSYYYRKKTDRDNISYWTCHRNDCNSSAKLVDGSFIQLQEKHSHPPDPLEPIQRTQRLKIKKFLNNDLTMPGPSAYRRAVEEIIIESEFQSDELGAGLKSYQQVHSFISKHKLSNLPKLPKVRSEIVIPNQCQFLPNREKFLLVDDGLEDKILIFGTIELFKLMCNSTKVWMDGTFYSCPKLFSQLYTLHFMDYDTMLPGIYALLPSKSSDIYIRLFRLLQDLAIENGLVFSPLNFALDFESATLLAIRTLFPHSKVDGCVFHFTQCIWRRVQRYGLVPEYKENNGRNSTAKTIQRLFALPFIRTEDIDLVFEYIVTECPDNEKMDQLMEYFWNTFVGSSAIFVNEIWNHSDNDGPRTTNHVEGWHSALNKSIGSRQPNIWKLINQLMSQHLKFKAIFNMNRHGATISKKTSKQKNKEERISKLTQRYREGQIDAITLLDHIKYFCASRV